MLASCKEVFRPYYLKWVYFPLFPARKPSYFDQCWSYPEVLLADLNRTFPARGGEDILFLPMTDWHTRQQRTQHLARALAARGHRCWMLSPHLGREFPSPPSRPVATRVNRLEEGIAEVHVHLQREPVFHHRRLRSEESERVARALIEVLTAAQVRHLAVLMSFPLWLDTARQVSEHFRAARIYDCHDVLSGFSNIAPELVEDEALAWRQSDWVLFSSAALQQEAHEALPELVDRSTVVRNGVHLESLQGCGACELPTARAGAVVGYVGALDWWFDVDAIATAAERHPEWSFVLIGRVEHSSIERLRRYGNVEFRGEVAYQDLSRHMNLFDVGLIPFEINPLTMGTNPIKLYEYFSFGLPVVSARLPEVEQFGDLVEFYSGPGNIAVALERALSEPAHDARKLRRKQAASHETWSERAQAIEGVLKDVQKG